MFFCYFIQQIAVKHKPQLRTPVAATAIVYFRRYFASFSYSTCDPSLLAASAVLLAIRSEEAAPASSGIAGARTIATAAKVV
ncbi:cyclin domain-containing protein, partial [Fonticula alba]